MAKYTVQTFIAGYSTPEGTDVMHCNSIPEIKRILEREQDRAESYGAGYEPGEALIWKDNLTDVTDRYPDGVATFGPRGGIKINWSV